MPWFIWAVCLFYIFNNLLLLTWGVLQLFLEKFFKDI